MKFITATEIAEITGFNRNSIHTYLSGYRFSKFRLIDAECMKTRFVLNQEFINVLYNFLWHRRKRETAEILKVYFKNFELKLMPLEEFIEC